MLRFIVVLDFAAGCARVLPFDDADEAEGALAEAGLCPANCQWMVTDTVRIGWPT